MIFGAFLKVLLLKSGCPTAGFFYGIQQERDAEN